MRLLEFAMVQIKNVHTITASDSHGEDASWYDSDEEACGPYGQDREWQKRSQHLYNLLWLANLIYYYYYRSYLFSMQVLLTFFSLVLYFQSGYRDGITAGQNASVQEGFNEGFKDSVLAGYKWGLVRGVTSALDFLPDQLKAQMVDTGEKRSEFKCLGETVGSVSSEDALKLFHEYVQMKKSEKIRGDVGGLSGSGSDCSSSLENYFEKLLLYLEKCPAIKMNLLGTYENKGV
ncbi:hypothetical protein Dimus_003341 [Dionaea muscipula]